MVNGETKSEIRAFTTGGTGSFSFAAAGDPQIGASGSSVNDTDGWEKTLKLISGNSAFDGVDFLLSAGDQVNTASNEDQYDGYLEHDTLLDLPTATVVGTMIPVLRRTISILTIRMKAAMERLQQAETIISYTIMYCSLH